MTKVTDDTLSVEVTPTLADYTAANRLVYISSSIWDALFRHTVLIAGFYFLMMSAMDVAQGTVSLTGAVRHLATGIIVGPFLALVTLAFLWIVMPLLARRGFSRQSIIGEKTVYSFTSNGMQAKGLSFESSIGWPMARDFLISNRVLLIRFSKTGFFLLPKGQIEERLFDKIIALLKDRQVKGPFPK